MHNGDHDLEFVDPDEFEGNSMGLEDITLRRVSAFALEWIWEKIGEKAFMFSKEVLGEMM